MSALQTCCAWIRFRLSPMYRTCCRVIVKIDFTGIEDFCDIYLSLVTRDCAGKAGIMVWQQPQHIKFFFPNTTTLCIIHFINMEMYSSQVLKTWFRTQRNQVSQILYFFLFFVCVPVFFFSGKEYNQHFSYIYLLYVTIHQLTPVVKNVYIFHNYLWMAASFNHLGIFFSVWHFIRERVFLFMIK